jgi:hypothetical protein
MREVACERTLFPHLSLTCVLQWHSRWSHGNLQFTRRGPNHLIRGWYLLWSNDPEIKHERLQSEEGEKIVLCCAQKSRVRTQEADWHGSWVDNHSICLFQCGYNLRRSCSSCSKLFWNVDHLPMQENGSPITSANPVSYPCPFRVCIATPWVCKYGRFKRFRFLAFRT